MPTFRRLSILIPVYNEERTVAELLRRVQSVELPLERELVVVDD
ncbi:MAG: glycosyltransferase, partial [Thermorudis peleae]|nr:glycosyltransferase [Thermorudis peleae]MBX6755298.1 glycosyltransferase [Thermorudis peleae]